MLCQITLTALFLHTTFGSPHSRRGDRSTPILGYNSYNDVACSPNNTWMETTIHAMADRGLVDLGYEYFQIDCGWQGFERLPNSSITYDPIPFPDGIYPLSDLARLRGMKWSMYTDQGVYACDTLQLPGPMRPGSLGYEVEDALMFAAWNTEYVKVDNCYIELPENAPKYPRSDFPSRFSVIWEALIDNGIFEMLICQWGTPWIDGQGRLEGPAQWTPPISTSFRLSDDIASGWRNVMRIVNQAIHINLRAMSRPGNFGDMDLLEVGNKGMTHAEQQSHFTIWAAFKSALMISTNVPSMSQETFQILSNREVIAVNQDELGEPVKLVQRFTNDHDIYSGPLANGDIAVLLLDTSNATHSLTIDFAFLGVLTADVKELWTSRTEADASRYTATVSAHGCILLRLSNIQPISPSSQQVTYFLAAQGILSGGADIQSCSGCSSGSKVGNLNANTSSSLSFTGIKSSETIQDVLFDYLNCEIGYTFADQGPNVRGANISVNGGPSQEVWFPVTGYDWDRDLLTNFRVRLAGFKVGSENNITITGDRYEGGMGLSGWAPEFYRIGIVS